MGKFLVTGATGFIGSNLCKKLVNLGEEVYIVCRKTSNLELLKDIINDINIFIYESDINILINYFKNIKFDCVFHLASLFIADHNEDQISKLIDSNIKFGCEILEAMKLSNTRNIINTSTSWQHFENHDYNPVCLYAATKQAFEDILIYYVNAYDFKVITLKLFDTYGENDNRNKLINNLKTIALKGEELMLSDGYQKIDLTHVDDVVEAYICAYKNILDSNFKGSHSYAVCNNRLVTLRELIAIFEKENNLKLNVSFGKRNYRFREVMKPWSNYEILPNWSSKILLEEGVKRIGKKA